MKPRATAIKPAIGHAPTAATVAARGTGELAGGIGMVELVIFTALLLLAFAPMAGSAGLGEQTEW